MFMALGVSALTVVVVLQLLDGRTGLFSGRLIASAVGVLMLLEGAVVLFTTPDLADPTAVVHGVAMMAAGAGIWSISHQSLWQAISSKRRQS
jgi:hypothetical protein